jgi:hypothetical protein
MRKRMIAEERAVANPIHLAGAVLINPNAEEIAENTPTTLSATPIKNQERREIEITCIGFLFLNGSVKLRILFLDGSEKLLISDT